MKKPVAECPHGARELTERRPGLLSRALGSKGACEACGASEELRVCQNCGYVGCCESHEGHDEVHFEATGHPFIRPYGGRVFGPAGWLWCYLCRAYLEERPA
jgi:uncharacterized UBP type Zn finger protein